jgi:hypothetical protein
MDNKEKSREQVRLALSRKKTKSNVYFASDLIAIYTAFRDQVYNPQSVFYPSCGYDGSPTKVFDRVTFVDLEKGNEGCISELQALGYRAFKQDIKEYNPEQLHDLLILLNPVITSESAAQHLISGGYIIANDYHSNATQMYNLPDRFTLWGTIDSNVENGRKNPDKVTISRDLEDLFQPIENEEEFRRYLPNEFEWTQQWIKASIDQKNINVDPNSSFEEQWKAYLEYSHERIPYRRSTDRYIFVKK